MPVLVKLEQLVKNFDKGLHNFYTNDKASFSWFRKGPCSYFHIRTITRLRNLLYQYDSYAQVCNDKEYTELLYATLTAWGMNRIGGGPKLQDFEKFCDNLRNNDLIKTLDSLKGTKLISIDDLELKKLMERVRAAYEYLAKENRVMKSGKAIVGVSKTLHHLLPDLLVPVDKTRIINFLHNLKEEDYRPSNGPKNYDSFENYWKCIKVSHYIARSFAEGGIREPSEWTTRTSDFQIKNRLMDTSIPKMIDNALLGLSETIKTSHQNLG